MLVCRNILLVNNNNIRPPRQGGNNKKERPERCFWGKVRGGSERAGPGALFVRAGAAALLEPAPYALCPDTRLFRGAARPGGAALFGKPRGGADQRLKPGIRRLKIRPLGTFAIGAHQKIAAGRNARRECFPEARRFRRVQPRNGGKRQAEGNAGVHLVDVLSARPARAGKPRFTRAAQGYFQKGAVHGESITDAPGAGKAL